MIWHDDCRDHQGMSVKHTAVLKSGRLKAQRKEGHPSKEREKAWKASHDR